MQWFTTWWEGLSSLQQAFACAALPATVILFLQTILLLFGIGGGHDADNGGVGDHDHDPGYHGDGQPSEEHDGSHHAEGVRIFTIRGLVAFFAVGGWIGIALADLGIGAGVSILAAVISGFLALLAVAYILKLFLSLQESGNFTPSSAISHTGTVYLTIPPSRSGTGKISLTVEERYLEMEAVTDYDKPIKSGAQVQVVSLSGESIAVVRPLVPISYTEEGREKVLPPEPVAEQPAAH